MKTKNILSSLSVEKGTYTSKLAVYGLTSYTAQLPPVQTPMQRFFFFYCAPFSVTPDAWNADYNCQCGWSRCVTIKACIAALMVTTEEYRGREKYVGQLNIRYYIHSQCSCD